jgi:hypothetical protein
MWVIRIECFCLLNLPQCSTFHSISTLVLANKWHLFDIESRHIVLSKDAVVICRHTLLMPYHCVPATLNEKSQEVGSTLFTPCHYALLCEGSSGLLIMLSFEVPLCLPKRWASGLRDREVKLEGENHGKDSVVSNQACQMAETAGITLTLQLLVKKSSNEPDCWMIPEAE